MSVIGTLKKIFSNYNGQTPSTGKEIEDAINDNFEDVKDAFSESFLENIKSWALSESFAISNPTFDGNGYVSGGVITWPDNDVGSISNVTVGTHGITSIRYNRSEPGKYATVNITYDGSGIVSNQQVVLTGF